MKHILIIEDDKKLNEGIRLALSNDQYEFRQCASCLEAKAALQKQDPDLILLDLNLPDGDGMELLKELRQKSQVPVIILTANNMEMDIVAGLECGANDYITKPFSLAVLRARVAVQLRDRREGKMGRIRIDDYDFNFESMEFRKNGSLIELSRTEQKLLRILCENRGATVPRSRLIDYVWAGDGAYVDEHALTVAVNRLREKLRDAAPGGKYIKTVYGIGYTWAVR